MKKYNKIIRQTAFYVMLLALLLSSGLLNSQSINNALHFDGDNDFITLKTIKGLPSSNAEFTVEMWFKVGSEGTECRRTVFRGLFGLYDGMSRFIVGECNGHLKIYYACKMQSIFPNPIFYTKLINAEDFEESLIYPGWHHIAVTRDGNELAVYLDCVEIFRDKRFFEVGKFNPKLFQVGKNVPYYIEPGYYQPNLCWHGEIDELRLWKVARSKQEIEQVNCRPCPLDPEDYCDKLIVYWKFDEGTPGGDNRGRKAVDDYSCSASNPGLLSRPTLNPPGFSLQGDESNYITSTAPSFPLPEVTCPADFSLYITELPIILEGATPSGGDYSGIGVFGGQFTTLVPGTYTITYAYTDGNGCINSCLFAITVLECELVQIVDFPVDVKDVCSGDDLTIDFTGVDVLNAINEVWTVDPQEAGSIVSDVFTLDAGFEAGTVTISLHAFNVQQCPGAYAEISFEVFPLPVIECPEFGPYCAGDNPVEFEGGDYYDFGGDIVFGFTPEIVGTYTFVYVVKNDYNCSVSCTFTIVVNPLPEVTCPEDFLVCIYEDPLPLAVGLPPGGDYSGVGVASNVFYPAEAGAGDHLITYLYQDTETLCTNSCTFTILVYPSYLDHTVHLYDAALQNPLSAICSGDPVHFSIRNSQGFTPEVPNVKTTISWYYSDNEGNDWVLIPSTQNKAMFSGFRFVSIPGHSATTLYCYQVAEVDRLYGANIVVGEEPDICEYWVEQTPLKICCPLSVSMDMITYVMPDNVPATKEVLCEGDEVYFVATISSTFSFPSSSTQISWFVSINGGEPEPLPDEDDKLTITYPTSGTIILTPGSICLLANISTCVCSPANISRCITVDPQPVCGVITEASDHLIPDPDGDPNLYFICPGDDAAVMVNPDYPFQNCQIQWQYEFPNAAPGEWIDLGYTNIIQNTNILPQLQPSASPYLWPAGETRIVYQIECRPLSYPNSGCDTCHSNKLEVRLLEHPETPIIIADEDKICFDDFVTLELANYNPANNYRWLLNGNVIGTGDHIVATQSGNYIVEVTDEYGCHSVLSEPFFLDVCTVVAKISYVSPSCPCPGEIVTLSAEESYSTCEGTLTFTWTFSSGTLISDLGSTIQHIPDIDGTTYWLVAVDENGCVGVATRFVVPCPKDQSFQCGVSTVIDADGNEYNTVLIGTQCWMAENLKTTHYSNNSPIDYPGLDGNAWQNNTTGAFAWHSNDIAWKNSYGALYNWYAVVNVNGICPVGWHLPNDTEWTLLSVYLIDNYPDITASNLGNKLKSCRQVNSPLGGACNTSVQPRWSNRPGVYGTDDFGFAALPGGYRNISGSYYPTTWYGLWWSSSEFDVDKAWNRNLSYYYGTFFRNNENKSLGYSVRCLMD